MDFKQHIAIVPDYPKEGIVFKDITPLMNDGKAYKAEQMQSLNTQKKEISML